MNWQECFIILFINQIFVMLSLAIYYYCTSETIDDCILRRNSRRQRSRRTGGIDTEILLETGNIIDVVCLLIMKLEKKIESFS